MTVSGHAKNDAILVGISDAQIVEFLLQDMPDN